MRNRIDSHRLISHFFRALSHRLRTPLSVVSNNLSSVGLQNDLAVLQSRRKVEEIALLLEELNQLCSPLKIEPIDLVAFAERLKEGRISKISSSIQSGAVFLGDAKTLLIALSELYRLIEEYGSKSSEISLDLSNSTQTVIFRYRSKVLSFSWLDGKLPVVSSLSELFNAVLDYDTPFAALIDGVLEAHDAKIVVTEELIDLSFPLQQQGMVE